MTDWTPAEGMLQIPFGPMGGGTVLIENVPPGDYYVKFSVWLEDCRAGSGEYHPCNDPYIPEYYNNSLTKGGATKIHVSASETTRPQSGVDRNGLLHLPDDLPECISRRIWRTTAARLPCSSRGKRAKPTGSASTNIIDWPNGGRYYFNYWKHGGPRIQNYTVPAGTKKDTLGGQVRLQDAADRSFGPRPSLGRRLA